MIVPKRRRSSSKELRRTCTPALPWGIAVEQDGTLPALLVGKIRQRSPERSMAAGNDTRPGGCWWSEKDVVGRRHWSGLESTLLEAEAVAIVVDAGDQSCWPPPEVMPGSHKDRIDGCSTTSPVASHPWHFDLTASNPNPVDR
jgi:hypothetical protein